MAITLYDEAVVKKLKSWISVPGLDVLSPVETSKAFENLADKSGDKAISLPVITVRRLPEFQIQQPHKQPKSFDGAAIKATKQYGYVRNAIAISLRYQIDIYTKNAIEGDELLREIIYNLINDPTITVEVPYNKSHLEHKSTMILDGSVTDNTDTDIKSVYDQFTRWTLQCSINDAYLFSVPKYDTVTAEIAGIVVEDDTTGNIL